MKKITLNDFEVAMAAQVGAARQIEALFGNFRDNLNNGSPGWNEHIEGAAAELAYAKAAGIYWDGSVNTFKRGDVGSVQIRSTNVVKGCLIIRPRDSDADTYMLVRGRIPTFEIVGSIKGKEAKQEKFLRNPSGVSQSSPAYFVPEIFLVVFN